MSFSVPSSKTYRLAEDGSCAQEESIGEFLGIQHRTRIPIPVIAFSACVFRRGCIFKFLYGLGIYNQLITIALGQSFQLYGRDIFREVALKHLRHFGGHGSAHPVLFKPHGHHRKRFVGALVASMDKSGNFLQDLDHIVILKN